MMSGMQGLSREEEKQLEKMRQLSLKQLELLRVRQSDYEKSRTGAQMKVAQHSAPVFGNVHISSEAKLQNGTLSISKKVGDYFEPSYISHDSRSTNSSKKFESYVPVSGKHSAHQIASDRSCLSKSDYKSSLSAKSAGADVNGKDQIFSKAYAGDSNSIFSRSYDANFLADESSFYNSYKRKLSDWRPHSGEGDSSSYPGYDGDSELLFGKGYLTEPYAGDHRAVYDKFGRNFQDELIETSESDEGSQPEVVTVTDSQVDGFSRARDKLAEASRFGSGISDLDDPDCKILNGDHMLGHIYKGKSSDAEKLKDGNEYLQAVASPLQPNSTDGTPKSILRHRKLIDDNVKVESKYVHTPTTSRTRTRRNLNFSYSEIDGPGNTEPKSSKSVNFLDAPISSNGRIKENSSCNNKDSLNSKEATFDATKKFSSKSLQENKKRSAKLHYAKPTDGSYTEEWDVMDSRGLGESEKVADSVNGEVLDGETSNCVPQQACHKNKVRELVQKNLLLNSGNDRKNASIIRELENRPKSVFDMTAVQPKHRKSGLDKKSDLESSVSKAYLDNPSTKEFSQIMGDRRGKPLLGYDWIAGLLDNEIGSVSTEPDDLFEAVKEFRRQNREECTGTSRLLNDVDLSRPITPEVPNPTHTCIHGFNVNERLFTEPVNADAKGASFCPVCLSCRQDPSENSPGFVRVSIPRSTLESPYKIKPHRRNSFDPIDSCALSQHCLAGYECSRPSSIVSAANLDLKHAAHGIKSQLIMTEGEARKIAESVSTTSQRNAPQPLIAPSVTIPRFNAEVNGSATLSSSQPNLSMSTRSSRDSRSITEELLSTSHDLRYQLQSLEKQRQILRQDEPNTTAFPLY